jgi:hypothetical protein
LSNHALSMTNAVYASTSWRITAPLRWVRTSLGLLNAGGGVKAKVKLLLRHAALYIGLRPRLKRVVLAALNRFPGTKARLFQVAARSVATQVHYYQPEQEASTPTALTPRARQIYADLKSALARRQQGNV